MEVSLPVHTIRYEDDDSEARVLLHLRNVVLLGAKGQMAKSHKETTGQCEKKAKEPRVGGHLLVTGSKVKARFEDGSWCRAMVEKDNGDGTLT
eukprot:5020312-Amphidinium_carterae.1